MRTRVYIIKFANFTQIPSLTACNSETIVTVIVSDCSTRPIN